MGERMSRCEMVGSSLCGHLTRYYLASGMVYPGNVVLDAACGTGYGAEVLDKHNDITYYGVDYNLSELIVEGNANRTFMQENLLSWEPDFSFDVFIGFETIEHLPSYDKYIENAKRAKSTILLSVPVVPTTHMNPWHLHNFEPGELPNMVVDGEWELFQALGQPTEFSEIYIFTRT